MFRKAIFLALAGAVAVLGASDWDGKPRLPSLAGIVRH